MYFFHLKTDKMVEKASYAGTYFLSYPIAFDL